MGKKKFEKVFEVYEKADQELHEVCENYLKGVLKNEDIDWDYDELEEYGIEMYLPYVSYDGGRHPEYASNNCSMVLDVYLNDDGEVCLELEESEEYNVDRVGSHDLYNVAFFVKTLLEARKK